MGLVFPAKPLSAAVEKRVARRKPSRRKAA
jgi:hypothetical protein